MPENFQQTPWSDKMQQAITMIDGGDKHQQTQKQIERGTKSDLKKLLSCLFGITFGIQLPKNSIMCGLQSGKNTSIEEKDLHIF